MDPAVIAQLLEINTRFYHDFGEAFAATRRRIQPGVRSVLATIPEHGSWLDLGCGSGALGREWAASGRTGSYLGLDFSEPLLREARKVTAGASGSRLSVRYAFADLMDPAWGDAFPAQSYDGVMAFASLHHIPGRENQRRFFSAVYRLLRPGGKLILSVWQFQNSAKLMERVLPWETVGLQETDVEPGDTLLDWRYALSGQQSRTGIRYVHLFSAESLQHLASAAGFSLTAQFYSDGAEGNLALYQIFQR